jgi:aminoglycoside phosphotransferase (APT) family kinase protein
VLDAWHALGLPCVEPLEWGYEGRASYLLTRFVAAPTLERPDALGERVEMASELIALMRRFHDAPVRVSRARTWEERMRAHLRWTLPLLRERGIAEPPGWEARLAELSAQGRCILHGDPAGGNVLQGPEGLILLDPPGALRGLREADAAQICSQIGGAEHAEELIDAVCARHRWLEPAAVEALAGVNFLTWAGYELAGHQSPDAAAGSLDVARRLLE